MRIPSLLTELTLGLETPPRVATQSLNHFSADLKITET
jgi:hypothetical protein